ncbi:hypothetical protein FPV67DRAFT_995684 [Lyophyllum atratum]|nr:hypothetical protein FPV67DRAFT_995684 [Lyophyllum atratum]
MAAQLGRGPIFATSAPLAGPKATQDIYLLAFQALLESLGALLYGKQISLKGTRSLEGYRCRTCRAASMRQQSHIRFVSTHLDAFEVLGTSTDEKDKRTAVVQISHFGTCPPSMMLSSLRPGCSSWLLVPMLAFAQGSCATVVILNPRAGGGGGGGDSDSDSDGESESCSNGVLGLRRGLEAAPEPPLSTHRPRVPMPLIRVVSLQVMLSPRITQSQRRD